MLVCGTKQLMEDTMMPDANNNCDYSLLHTLSSTAVPVSLIISSQVDAQSGDSMSSQTLQENPVTITFTVEGVGCIDIQTSDHSLIIAVYSQLGCSSELYVHILKVCRQIQQ